MDYGARARVVATDDDTNFPYESVNPLEGLFDGLKPENSDLTWNDDDDALDDGLWSNHVEKPRYKILSRNRIMKAEKKIRPLRFDSRNFLF